MPIVSLRCVPNSFSTLSLVNKPSLFFARKISLTVFSRSGSVRGARNPKHNNKRFMSLNSTLSRTYSSYYPTTTPLFAPKSDYSTLALRSQPNRMSSSSSSSSKIITTDTVTVSSSASSLSSTGTAAAFSTTATATTVRYPAETLQPRVQSLLRQITAVCFDVDSTVVTVEGIDEFAAHTGKKEEVAALTKAAMGGSVPFDVALENRLRIINPTHTILKNFLEHHPFHFTPGIEEVIDYLHSRSIPVYLVSGGFTQMIYPVADRLRIPRHHVYANTILFDPVTGNYTGFDRNAPTSRDGGKAEVLQRLKVKYPSYANGLVMVGDGATDLQARPPADLMIGYGGIIVRETVAKGADWFVRDFYTVLKELQGEKIK